MCIFKLNIKTSINAGVYNDGWRLCKFQATDGEEKRNLFCVDKQGRFMKKNAMDKIMKLYKMRQTV